MIFKEARRRWHTPKESSRALATRFGRTPPEHLRSKDAMEARILRANRARALEKAIQKGRNPYAVDLRYPKGEFWPYGPEMANGVYGYGLIRNGCYMPDDPEAYEYDGGGLRYGNEEDEEEEEWQSWEYLEDGAHRLGMPLEEFLERAGWYEMDPEEFLQRMEQRERHHRHHSRGHSDRGRFF